MTVRKHHGGAKAPQAQNSGMSQAVPHKTVDNVFDGWFAVDPGLVGYRLGRVKKPSLHFDSLDDLMTFLASAAIEKMGRRSS